MALIFDNSTIEYSFMVKIYEKQVRIYDRKSKYMFYLCDVLLKQLH